MDNEEFKFDNKVIEIEERNEIKASYKIKSYNNKIAMIVPYRACVSGNTENKILFPNNFPSSVIAAEPEDAAIP